ncbi:Abi family protein [Ligilactobacillus sp. WILCCON 0076]|uniref:Abi family protein n=1 Tax=Ligilactobacillus ubinensis TaxID=2876789 RepID=A0A9X2JK83_9LACO|nr:Abi family protein [Ligilactobacillus ubinensis]MCP0885929.1 Abi family protein [Ligilactobacillus ubinensis]
MNNDVEVLEEQELLDKLGTHGIKLTERERTRNIRTIKRIGYYKLKEFAILYQGNKAKEISFEDLLSRYYYDKALRMGTLHAIEDIEIYFHNCIGELFAKSYGPFGYLKFSNWCDRGIDRNKVIRDERDFKYKLERKKRKSNLPDLNVDKNIKDGFPTVWLAMELLMFGELVYIFKNMSPKNKKEIAKKFNAKPTDLLSWLECLNLIRNICCHNSDLIDLKLRTQPVMPPKYQEVIFSDGTKQTNRIAIALVILRNLMDVVNKNYDYKLINDSLCKIMRKKTSYAGGKRRRRASDDVMNNMAHELGFKNASAIDIFSSHHSPRKIKRMKKKRR